MAENSKIEWTTHTFNPWRGCTKISPGCANCYAERGSKRNSKVLGIWGDTGTRVLAAQPQWREPYKWACEALSKTSRPRVFCASLADVFEDWEGQMTNHKEEKLYLSEIHPGGHCTGPEWPGAVPYTLNHAREKLWKTIRETPELDWLLLTKRPENITGMMPEGDWPNVWLGTTVENQDHAIRLDILQDTKERINVPILFCSAEPLLGPLNLYDVLSPTGINWIIVGGESGAANKVRPFQSQWAVDIIQQCAESDIDCFIKQLGVNNDLIQPNQKDPKCDDITRWPSVLQLRKTPTRKI